MKTKTWILLFTILLVVCLFLSFFLLRPARADFAEILSGGKVVRRVNLQVADSFTIATPQGGSNTITIQDGAIAVTEANCPDHYCMHRGFCTGGAQIVCLPNQLIIRFVAEDAVDGVVG